VWGNKSVRRVTRAALVMVGGAAFLFVPSVAGAQEVSPYGGGSTVVSPTSVVRDPVGDPGSSTNTSSGSLPFTGGDVAGLAAIGAGAVGVGVVASRARRRRTA
jgi:hypothetical protein